MALALLVCGYFFMQGEGYEAFWRHWLVVSLPMEQADALIVLGGEPRARPLEAARLYKAGVAPRVFVSGVGDASRNRQILIGAGVPAEVITMESKAISTYTNATMLKALLAAVNVRSALIITSPFHTRRALATFRKVIPEIDFGVTDALADRWKLPEGHAVINRLATVEFLKTMEYWLLYGVSPSLSLPKSHPRLKP